MGTGLRGRGTDDFTCGAGWVVTDEVVVGPEVGADEEETPLLPFASPLCPSLVVRDKRLLILFERLFILL